MLTLQDFLQCNRVELDQRLRRAVEISGLTGETDSFNDGRVFHALYQLNSIITRRLQITGRGVGRHRLSGVNTTLNRLELRFEDREISGDLLDRALRHRRNPGTLSARDFLLAVIELSLERGDHYSRRPHSADLLALEYGGFSQRPLAQVPELISLLRELRKDINEGDDFQYVLGLHEGQIVFRVANVLDDFVQQNNDGIYVPQRAILTHFRNEFAGFTPDEVNQLEELLNHPSARESDFQRFFESCPHFLRKWDYREIHPHVVLASPEGALVPDFILTDRELQRAAMIELKLPNPKLIRRQANRDRFAAAVIEARAQLLRYRDWFRDRHNREMLKESVGMEIYEPHMIVVIGRSTEFNDALDRQRLRAGLQDIEVVTYDDILTFARRRRIIVEDFRNPRIV